MRELVVLPLAQGLGHVSMGQLQHGPPIRRAGGLKEAILPSGGSSEDGGGEIDQRGTTSWTDENIPVMEIALGHACPMHRFHQRQEAPEELRGDFSRLEVGKVPPLDEFQGEGQGIDLPDQARDSRHVPKKSIGADFASHHHPPPSAPDPGSPAGVVLQNPAHTFHFPQEDVGLCGISPGSEAERGMGPQVFAGRKVHRVLGFQFIMLR